MEGWGEEEMKVAVGYIFEIYSRGSYIRDLIFVSLNFPVLYSVVFFNPLTTGHFTETELPFEAISFNLHHENKTSRPLPRYFCEFDLRHVQNSKFSGKMLFKLVQDQHFRF